jgi:protein-tyrosine-phosphatase
MLASETSALATKAYQAAMDPGIDDISRQDIQRRFAYAATEEIADVTSQFGISNFRKQSTTRLSGNEGQAKKLLLSYDYFKQLNTLDSSGATVQMAQQIENQKVSLSLSVADRVQNGQSFQTINMVWKQGRDASNLTAKSIAEQLFDDFISSDNYKNIDSANVAELDQQAANIRTTYGTSSMSKLQIEGQKDEIVQKITQSIDERGIGIASLGENTKEEQRLVSNVIEYFNKSGVDILTENIENIQADIIGESDDIVQMGHLYDPTVIEAGGDAAKKRLAQANLTAIDDASTIGKALSSDPNLLRTAQSRLKAGRRQTPISTAVENYHKFKGPAGVAALGLTALAAGYYIGRKKQETDLYDETLEEQPTQSFRQNNLQNNYTSSITSLNSSRRDPLVTAGVVGNLDRKKIGHTQMGNNKNNHLYGR